MAWLPALHGQFFRVDYKIEMRNPSNQLQIFQGVAFYRAKRSDGFDAFWADNSGDLHPITIDLDGNALIANWGVEGAKQGRTRYELVDSQTMEVTDWIKTDEGWREFNKNEFIRLEEVDTQNTDN